MKKGIISASVLTALVGILTLIAILLPKLEVAKESITTGSVTQGNEYFSTTTRQGNTGLAMTSGTLIKTGVGALGSVVISGSAGGAINLYDGTTTLAHADRATTTLATIPASAVGGTYTFDSTFKDGLVVELVGTSVATATITYR